MSVVTDIILVTGRLADDDPGIIEVQKWLEDRNWPKLVEISGHAGGNKVLQADLWTAAINHFTKLGEFIEVVRKANWYSLRAYRDFPENIQLLVKEEHQEQFTDRLKEFTF